MLVIVPTYNEVENLERILDRLRTSVPTAHALVVDDGSPDGTGELADKLAPLDPRVHVLHRTARPGWVPPTSPGSGGPPSAGTTSSWRWTPTGRTPPEQLPRAAGRRSARRRPRARLPLRARGSGADWPGHRLLLSRIGNLYTRWALRLPLSDATGGYRAARGELIDSLPFDDVASQGYCFQVDWAWRAVRAGARVSEVPITFTERAFGRSKISGSIVREALVRVTVWGLKDRLADWLPSRVSRPVPARSRDGGR